MRSADEVRAAEVAEITAAMAHPMVPRMAVLDGSPPDNLEGALAAFLSEPAKAGGDDG
jgi:hypothetical protein